MSDFTVRMDVRDVERCFDRLKERAPFAIARALNKTADSATARMIRFISADTGVKQKDLRGTTKRNRAIWSSQATPGNQTVKVYANTERIPLYDFGARQTRRGVTAKLGPSRKLYPSTFIATMPSGHRGAWKRTGSRRLPITELHGPSIAHVWQKHALEAWQHVQERLPISLQHEIRFALSQGGVRE